MPESLPLFKPPYSRLTANQHETPGEHVWMVPLGDGNGIRRHPMLKDLNLPPVGGDQHDSSGPLLTEDADRSRDHDRRDQRWTAAGRARQSDRPNIASVDLPGLAIGTPMTYMIDNKAVTSR